MVILRNTIGASFSSSALVTRRLGFLVPLCLNINGLELQIHLFQFHARWIRVILIEHGAKVKFRNSASLSRSLPAIPILMTDRFYSIDQTAHPPPNCCEVQVHQNSHLELTVYLRNSIL